MAVTTEKSTGATAISPFHHRRRSTSYGGGAGDALAEQANRQCLYWLTNTGTSSSRSYWEGAQAGGGPFNAVDVPSVPMAVTVFLAEMLRAAKLWRAHLRQPHPLERVDKGGSFAAWEHPPLFSQEVRTAFRSLR
jgi:hypothetical protein